MLGVSLVRRFRCGTESQMRLSVKPRKAAYFRNTSTDTTSLPPSKSIDTPKTVHMDVLSLAAPLEHTL